MTDIDSRELSGCAKQLLLLVSNWHENKLPRLETFPERDGFASHSEFPADYVALLEAFGDCDWLGHVSIYSPGEKLARLQSDFREDFPTLCELGVVPEQLRFPVYPDRGGVLCVGGNDNGGYLGWLTQGERDEWPVVLVSDDGCDVEVHHRTLSCLLLGWITGEISSNVLLPAELLRSWGRPLFRKVPYSQ